MHEFLDCNLPSPEVNYAPEVQLRAIFPVRPFSFRIKTTRIIPNLTTNVTKREPMKWIQFIKKGEKKSIDNLTSFLVRAQQISLHLSYIVSVKSTVKISQNFVAFSEYVNFTKLSIANLKFEILHCKPNEKKLTSEDA